MHSSAFNLSSTDACKYHIVKHIFSGGDQTFVLCSEYEVKQIKYLQYLLRSASLSQHLLFLPISPKNDLLLWSPFCLINLTNNDGCYRNLQLFRSG